MRGTGPPSEVQKCAGFPGAGQRQQAALRSTSYHGAAKKRRPACVFFLPFEPRARRGFVLSRVCFEPPLTAAHSVVRLLSLSARWQAPRMGRVVRGAPLSLAAHIVYADAPESRRGHRPGQPQKSTQLHRIFYFSSSFAFRAPPNTGFFRFFSPKKTLGACSLYLVLRGGSAEATSLNGGRGSVLCLIERHLDVP